MVACQRLGQICRRKTGADVKKIVTVEAYRFGTFGQQRNGEVHQGYRAQIRGRTSYGALVRAVLWNADALAIDAEFRRLTPEGVTPADMRIVVEMDGEERSRMRRVDGREFSERTFNVSQGRFVVLTGPAQELHRARTEAAAVHSRAARFASAGDLDGAFRELNAYVADFSRIATHGAEFSDAVDASAQDPAPAGGTGAPADGAQPEGALGTVGSPAAGQASEGTPPDEVVVAQAPARTEADEAAVAETPSPPEAVGVVIDEATARAEAIGAVIVETPARTEAAVVAAGQTQDRTEAPEVAVGQTPTRTETDEVAVAEVGGAVPAANVPADAPAVHPASRTVVPQAADAHAGPIGDEAASGKADAPHREVSAVRHAAAADVARSMYSPMARAPFGAGPRAPVPLQRSRATPVPGGGQTPPGPAPLPSETPEAVAIRELGLSLGGRPPRVAPCPAPAQAAPTPAAGAIVPGAAGIPGQSVRRASGFVTAGPVPAPKPVQRQVPAVTGRPAAPVRQSVPAARTSAPAQVQPRPGPSFRR